MIKNISKAAICQMQEEVDQLEAQGRVELKDPKTHAVGRLRMDLVQECRRRLSFIATTMPRDPHDV